MPIDQFEKMTGSDDSDSSSDDDTGRVALARIRRGRRGDDDDDDDDTSTGNTSLDAEEFEESSEKQKFRPFHYDTPQKSPSTPQQEPQGAMNSPCVSPVPVIQEKIDDNTSHQTAPSNGNSSIAEQFNGENNSLQEELENLQASTPHQTNEEDVHPRNQEEEEEEEAEEESIQREQHIEKDPSVQSGEDKKEIKQSIPDEGSHSQSDPQELSTSDAISVGLPEPCQQPTDKRTILQDDHEISTPSLSTTDDTDKHDELDITKNIPPTVPICDMSNEQRTAVSQRSVANIAILNASRNLLSQLSNLPFTLVRLDVSRNSLVELSGISHLVNLEVANFRRNHIRQISGLDSCLQLRHLFLGYNPIKKIENIEHLQHLETLDCSHTNLSTSSSIRALSLNKQLKTLMLQGSPIADPSGRRRVVLSNLPLGCDKNFINKLSSSYGFVLKVENRSSPEHCLSFCVTYSSLSFTLREAITASVASRENDLELSGITVCKPKTKQLVIKEIPKFYKYSGKWDDRLSAPLKRDMQEIIEGVLSSSLQRAVASYEIKTSPSWGYKERLSDRTCTPFSGQLSLALSNAYQLSNKKGIVQERIVSGGPFWEFDFSSKTMKDMLTKRIRYLIVPTETFDLHITFREGDDSAKLFKEVCSDNVMSDVCRMAGIAASEIPPNCTSVDEEERLLSSRQLLDVVPLVSNLCPQLKILDDKKLTGKGRESIYQSGVSGSSITLQSTTSLFSSSIDISMIAASAYDAASEKYSQQGSELDAILKTPIQLAPSYSAPRKAKMMHARMQKSSKYGGKNNGSPPRAVQQTVSSFIKQKTASPSRSLGSDDHDIDTSQYLQGRILPMGSEVILEKEQVNDLYHNSPRRDVVQQTMPPSDKHSRFRYDEIEKTQPIVIEESNPVKKILPHQLRSRSKGLGKGPSQPVVQKEKYFKVSDNDTHASQLQDASFDASITLRGSQSRHQRNPAVSTMKQPADESMDATAFRLEKVLSKMCKTKGKAISTPLVQSGQTTDNNTSLLKHDDINGLSAIADDSYATRRKVSSKPVKQKSKSAFDILQDLQHKKHPELEESKSFEAKNVRFAPGSSPPTRQDNQAESKTRSGLTDLVAAWESQYGSDFVTLHLALKTLLVLVEEGSSGELLRYKEIVRSCGMLDPADIPPEVSLYYGITSESAAQNISHSSSLSKKDQLLAMISQTYQTKACLEYIFTLMEENNYSVLAEYLTKVKESLCVDNQYIDIS